MTRFQIETMDGKQYVVETLSPHGARVTTLHGPFKSTAEARRLIEVRKRAREAMQRPLSEGMPDVF